MIDPVSPALQQASLASATRSGEAVATAAEQPAESFGAFLGDAAMQFRSNLATAEQAAIAGMKGEAPVADVVAAVMEAERSLRLAVGIRDKVVSAWMEVSRMQI
jgi:flagellar hook-basal body complex protein FliE